MLSCLSLSRSVGWLISDGRASRSIFSLDAPARRPANLRPIAQHARQDACIHPVLGLCTQQSDSPISMHENRYGNCRAVLLLDNKLCMLYNNDNFYHVPDIQTVRYVSWTAEEIAR